MDEAHKHLNISEAEWGVFMEIFNDVCAEFRLPAEDVDDLNALMISMEDECVVYEGERPWRDPGQRRPGGNSAYGLVGGVYPIALFVDRLVDALIADDRFAVATDSMKRTPSSLKYCLTEAVCADAGGPEIVTARNAPETSLGVPQDAWEAVKLTARKSSPRLTSPLILSSNSRLLSATGAAADHIDNERARRSLLSAFEWKTKAFVVSLDHKKAIKLPSLAGGKLANRAAVVKSHAAAAAGSMISKEAFETQRAAMLAGSQTMRTNAVAARKAVFGDPRTLYGRGGGVFGLARLVDKLMDAWMDKTVSPTLNDNTKVARWHETEQRCGFKFLVTQLMGYLTGGPQRYTGRPMDVAHKHLGISRLEWAEFTAVAERVLKDAGVHHRASKELMEIIAGFEDLCTLRDGEIPCESCCCILTLIVT